MSRDVMKMALEALEAETAIDWECNSYHPKIWPAMAALRSALAQPEPDMPPWEDRPDEWTEACEEAHPMNAGSGEHWEAAMKMVGNRHSKYALVGLVAWLLHLAHSRPAPEPQGEPVAHYGIIDPDYARVFTIARCLAWAEGYALAMHGSFTRDLDMIATPWTDKPCEPAHLVNRIADAAKLKLKGGPPTKKPHGRLAWSMGFEGFGDPRWVDLSVVEPRPQRELTDEEIDAVAREIRAQEFGTMQESIRAFARAILAARKA